MKTVREDFIGNYCIFLGVSHEFNQDNYKSILDGLGFRLTIQSFIL